MCDENLDFLYANKVVVVVVVGLMAGIKSVVSKRVCGGCQ